MSRQVRLIVWCRDCGRQVEPEPGEMAERYGAETTVIDWHARLTRSGCAADRLISWSPEPNAGNLRARNPRRLTFAGTRADDKVAPTPDLPDLALEQGGST
jgi:hypothetical protein